MKYYNKYQVKSSYIQIQNLSGFTNKFLDENILQTRGGARVTLW